MDLDTHYFANTSLAAGGFFLVGDKGDDDPGHAVQQALLTNDGTVVLRVGASLTGVKGTRWKSLPVGQTLPFDLAEGLVIHNPHASTAGAISGFALCARGKELDWSGRKGRKDNAKIDTRYLTPRLTFTPGAVADTTLLFPRKVTISSLKVETLVTVTGGVITLDVLNEANESLLSAVFDLETLVAKTLTPLTLTATTSRLTIEKGKTVRLRVSSSAGGDAGGPIAAELGLVRT